MRNIVKSAFVRACITFTVAMALWCTAGLIFAGPVEGIVITLSLLAAALALCALQAFWFTEAVIGRLSYPARIAGFGLTGLPALVLCAALGGWFPLDNIGAWVSFVAIYLVTLAAITAGYTIYYRQLRRRPRPLPRRPERVGHRDEKRLRRSSSALSPPGRPSAPI